MNLKPAYTAMLVGVVVTAGCSVRTPDILDRDGAPANFPDMSHVPDAVPRPESPSRYGNPETYEVFGKQYRVMTSSQGYVARGMASWYGTKFHGRRTSSGEPYDMFSMTAAHKHLPLPTYAQVVNLENNRSVVVRINDRGPFHNNRLIDLSYAAASKLGVLKNGTAMVEVRAIDTRASQQPRQTTESPTQVTTRETAYTKTPDTTKVFLQAGAFSSQTNAIRFRDRLAESLAREVRVHSSEDGSGLHRVRVGPLASREQENTVASQLQRMGLANTRVVID